MTPSTDSASWENEGGALGAEEDTQEQGASRDPGEAGVQGGPLAGRVDPIPHPSAPSAPSLDVKKRKKRKLPKIISAAEADRLFWTVDDGTDTGHRNRLMLELMYRAGLRVSEVVAIRPRDIERDGLIHLYDAKGGDGTAYFDPDRILPLLDHWLPIRTRWLYALVEYESAPLFIKPGGAPVSVRYLQRLVKRAKEGAGIGGKCTPHVLRHSFATELIEEGFSLPEVQAALRHANLATTAIYLHVRDETLRRKITRRGQAG